MLSGLPPEGDANFAWMQHMIWHLAPGGRVGKDIQKIASTYNAFAERTLEEVRVSVLWRPPRKLRRSF